ncbi:hypothetical protein K9L16_01245 [Candidatus Pacearchaeota archaeon]|nr:hypothetical protein [Candidatus Pacearchaeota archaeon]
MITYNDLYEYARKERYSNHLQKLPKQFISNISEYMKEKKKAASKEDDVFSDIVIKTKKQLENAMTLFRELILRRRKKILDLVLIATETGISKQDFENMLDFEKELFENLMSCIESSDKKMNSAFNDSAKVGVENNMIIFREDVEEFMDFDSNTIGPFSKGDIANVPKNIAKILIEDNKAELIEK